MGSRSVVSSRCAWARGMVVVMLLTATAGCSSSNVAEPQPVVQDRSTPSPTPTPTPEAPVKPERPADMERTDEVGAAAAAVYFLELYPYVKGTGDLAEWQAISLPERCEFCSKLVASTQELVNRQQTFVGGEISVEVTKTYPLDGLLGGYPLDAVVTQAEFAIHGNDGAIVSTQPESSTSVRIEVIHDGAQWRLLEVSTEMSLS
jgi:hypothetical protein